jgi:penicillin-binding protein 2
MASSDKRSSRLGVLALVGVLLLGALGTRMWFLQGVQAQEFQAKLSAAKTRTVYVPPERGRIFDADGRAIADNKRILTVTVDWSVLRDRQTRLALMERLSGPLQTPADELMRRYDPCYGAPAVPRCTRGQIYSTLLPLPLKEDVDEETVAYLKERREDYPGIDVTEQWQRVYPYAPLASHVVGSMGALTPENLTDYLAKGYNRNELVGQFGVELSFEDHLHGKWGQRIYEIDAAGAIVRELIDERVDPIAGNDVQLTVDLDVQQYAEQALQTELEIRRNLPDGPSERDGGEPGGGQRAHNGIDPETNERRYQNSREWGATEWVPFKAPAGSVVVENHQTGQILAMASYPTFDNRWMVADIDGDKFKELFPATDDPDKSLLVNRAVQGQYNLGSTIKPFIAWSGLNSGIIDANYTFLDNGTYTLESIDPSDCQERGGIAKCTFKNAISSVDAKPSRYGPVRVEDAIAVSSDAFFYRLGEMFYLQSRTLLKENLTQFGFGAESGIQLPFEWSGRIPDDDIKRQLVDNGVLAEGEVPRLTVGDNVQVAIGQGLMAATPLQLANAYSTLANNGFLLQPQIVKAIYAPLTPDLAPGVMPFVADLAAGTVVQSFESPIVRAQLNMPPEIRDPIVNGTRRVIRGKGTTYPGNWYHATTGESLFASFPPSIDLHGKTGTAQGAANFPWNDSSAFGSFAGNPEMPYTVVAYLEKAGYGARAAAPVANCLFLALADPTRMDQVAPSDPLDTASDLPAKDLRLTDRACLGGISTVRD